MDFLARQVIPKGEEAGVRGFKVAYRINKCGKPVSPTEGLLNALMLLYADDLVLLAPDSQSLEAALLVLDQVARKWAMSVKCQLNIPWVSSLDSWVLDKAGLYWVDKL